MDYLWFITVDATLHWGSYSRENGCDPVLTTRASRWSARMMMNALRGQKRPERFTRYASINGQSTAGYCPVCDEPVDGFGRTTVSPCGHSAAETTLRRILQSHE
jgi:hypothetical protein